jgi:hypothetical protein
MTLSAAKHLRARAPRGPDVRLAALALACLPLLVGASGSAPDRGLPGAGPVGSAAVTSPLSTFAQIYSTSLPDYNSCQFKLSYLGEQEKSGASLAAVVTLRTGGFERTPFLAFQHHGYYGNDFYFGDTLRVTTAEIKSFMDAIQARPALQDTLAPAEPKVSLMVMRGYGVGLACWEHVTATAAEGDTLFQLLHDAVSSSTDKATVDQFRHHMVGVRQ